jgi:hypothetical protein
VPVTSAARNRLFFFLFLLQPFTVLMKQTRQVLCAVKQSIFLRGLWFHLMARRTSSETANIFRVHWLRDTLLVYLGKTRKMRSIYFGHRVTRRLSKNCPIFWKVAKQLLSLKMSKYLHQKLFGKSKMSTSNHFWNLKIPTANQHLGENVKEFCLIKK